MLKMQKANNKQYFVPFFKEYRYWILFFLLLFFIWLSFVIITNVRQKYELKTYGEYTTAEITGYTTVGRYSPRTIYQYEVNGVVYQNTLSIRLDGCLNPYCIGKFFKLKYSKRNPKIHKIILDSTENNEDK